MLSMVLAVTRDLGITQFEAQKNLKTSFQADYSHPTGSFLFTSTDDVRTKTREPNFAIAIKKLEERGKKARTVTRMLPPAGELCSGVMIGTPDFSWNQSGSKLLPGAIADNLTSLGGAMTTNAQTKATEFLRFGAAASSGAVTEPYTIPNKFPHPMIHVHYVDGLTTAEAFYSSVLCPYQLLIVGDPLCQPYCKPPRFIIENKTEALGDNKQLMVSLKAEESTLTTEPEILQWIVNGVLRNQTPYDTQLRMRFEKTEPGAHEIRLLVKAAKPIEERYEQSFWFTLGQPSEQIILDAPKAWQLSSEKPLIVSVKQIPETGDIKIVHEFEEVGMIPNGKSAIELSPTKVGYGPVRLHAEQKLANGQIVRSLPVVVAIEP